MSALVRLLLPLMGYLCVGTVISAALGYGYLRHSGKLDDETMFRIAALVHGVDLDAMNHPQAASDGAATPPEEPSFHQQQQQVQAAALHVDAKQKQLADSLVYFNYQLEQLNSATAQYAKLRDEVEKYLREQGELVVSAKMTEVRQQIESLIPKKQAKPLLIQMIEDERIDEVILLLSSMKDKNRQNILKTFDTEQDLQMLYRIQRKMLAGEPVKPEIDARLKALEQLKAQEK